MSSNHSSNSLLLPLRHSRFRQLWLANLLSSLGTWMQAFAVSWEIASVSHSALMLSLFQALSWAPVLFFSLPAGVLADRSFRPALLLRSNIVMASVASVMVLSTVFAKHSIPPLLLLSFVMATGAAFTLPAWQASMSGLVQPYEVEAAATLNNVSYNTAALLGPAIGGACFDYVGPGGLFLFNACSFFALIYLYLRWCAETLHQKAPASARSSSPAVRDVMLMCWRSVRYRHLLGNAACIFYSSSALFVVLPLLAAKAAQTNASGYGIMMGMLGAGALFSGLSLPVLRNLISRRVLLAGALAIYCGMLMVVGNSHTWLLQLSALFSGGMTWAAIVSTLNGAAQSTFPDAMRASTLAVFILAVAIGQTIGSVSWGGAGQLSGCRSRMHGSRIAHAFVLIAYFANGSS